MMIETSEYSCDAIRADIPWYLNGTLSNSVKMTIREHTDQCEACKADLEAHRLMRDAVLDRELTPIVPLTTPEQLFAANQEAQHRRTIGGRVANWSMALAACVAVVSFAFVLLNDSSMTAEIQNQTFETATSPGAADGIDYVLRLHFDDGVSAEKRAEIAAGLAGAIRWTVDDRGTYEVHLRLSAPSLETLQEFEASVGSMPGVDSAEFTALQLPMK
ncbi:MAG: zf-HC2 domain-containing protein [Woeseiaceae bacterium]